MGLLSASSSLRFAMWVKVYRVLTQIYPFKVATISRCVHFFQSPYSYEVPVGEDFKVLLPVVRGLVGMDPTLIRDVKANGGYEVARRAIFRRTCVHVPHFLVILIVTRIRLRNSRVRANAEFFRNCTLGGSLIKLGASGRFLAFMGTFLRLRRLREDEFRVGRGFNRLNERLLSNASVGERSLPAPIVRVRARHRMNVYAKVEAGVLFFAVASAIVADGVLSTSGVVASVLVDRQAGKLMSLSRLIARAVLIGLNQ